MGQGGLLSTSTDSPTVLVTGGHLTFGQNWIDESTGANNAAIKVTGGVVDYGFDVVTNINGEGGFFDIPNRQAIRFPQGIDDFLVPNLFAKDGVMLAASHRSATSLTSSPAMSSVFGQAVTFTATVDTNVENLGYATGTVAFYDGATLLGTVPLQISGGVATAAFTTSSLSVGSHTITAVYSGDNLFVSSSAELAHQVVPFSFNGFFPPVDNPPTVNLANAGRAIPVKFSLSGYRGMNIIAPGYPKSVRVNCNDSVPVGAIEETSSNSGLSYDAASDQYNYVWKTEKSWAGTCRQFILRLTDGTDHVAFFKFK